MLCPLSQLKMILLDTMWHKYDTSPPTAPSHSPPLTLPTLFSRLPSTQSLRGSMRSKPGAPSRRVLPCLPLVGPCGTGAATAVSPRHQQWPLPSQEGQHVALSLYVVLLGSNILPGVSMGTNTPPPPLVPLPRKCCVLKRRPRQSWSRSSSSAATKPPSAQSLCLDRTWTAVTHCAMWLMHEAVCGGLC